MGLNISKFGSRKKYGLNSEINVTPFVDVMLVLLIIFMVTSPMLVSGVDVDLPTQDASPISGQDEPLAVTIDKDGVIYIQDAIVVANELTTKIKAIIGEKKETRVFIRGDRNVNYGRVVQIFYSLRAAGIKNVLLVSSVSDNAKLSEKSTQYNIKINKTSINNNMK